MNYNTQYLTYAEYIELGGSEIGETPFNLLEFEARRKVDIRTQDRLVNSEEIPQEVKLCIFKMINSILDFTKTQTNIANSGVSSENIDGYSVSYISPGELSNIVNSMNKTLDDIIMTYLLRKVYNNEHLLYAGVK